MPQPSEVVLLPFPFTDLSATKLRPVLVILGANERGDFLAAQITSQTHHAVQEALSDADFELGALPKASIVRPDKLFSLNRSSVVRRAGKLNADAFLRVQRAVCRHLGCRG